MIYYKYVDLPHVDEIIDSTRKKLDEFYYANTIFKHFTPEWFETPELREAIETIKPWDEIAHISIITTQPWAHIVDPDTNIHQDVMALTDRGQEQAVCLNIPIYNCETTYVAIYDELQGPFKLEGTYKNGAKYTAYHWLPDWCVEKEKMYLPKPALFYTQMPHAIINESEHSRIIMSVRFSTPIDLETYEG
jgi:hypothetical protein